MSVVRFRRLLDAAERGELTDAEITAWLLESGRRYLSEAPSGLSLEKALGIAPGRGERSSWTREAEAARDEALRVFAREHFPDLPIADAALEIAVEARRLRALRAVPSDNRKRQLASLDAKRRVPGPDRLKDILSSGNEIA